MPRTYFRRAGRLPTARASSGPGPWKRSVLVDKVMRPTNTALHRSIAFATAAILLLYLGLYGLEIPRTFNTTSSLSAAKSSQNGAEMKSMRFPNGFMWGTATASYQIEGAVAEDREPSIWDRFTATEGKTHKGQTGEKACDHYHLYKDDVQLMKNLNTKYYRFSIAWPRIQTFSKAAPPERNEAGIRFYNNLIDELLANGITPFVTLYHWDLPLSVESATGGGWAGDGDMSKMFAEYARICFDAFGDRVKNWITLNEPWCSSLLGYETGVHAPGFSSRPGRAAYRAAHQLLLSHARAVEVYRNEFQAKQNGKIGITLDSMWAEPYNSSDPVSVAAAQRDMDFKLGWFADPIWRGDYPASMRQTVGDRLPMFSDEEKKLLKGSSDFFGVNHYSTKYTVGMWSEMDRKDPSKLSCSQDKGTVQVEDKEWKKTEMGWGIVPWGFRKLLLYIHSRYQPTGGIIVTENGMAASEGSREEMERDMSRVEFYSGYIAAVHEAIEGGADVRGYFLWSLMDNFEWACGYEKRFGLYYTDYTTMARIPKPASKWYAKVAGSNILEIGQESNT